MTCHGKPQSGVKGVHGPQDHALTDILQLLSPGGQEPRAAAGSCLGGLLAFGDRCSSQPPFLALLPAHTRSVPRGPWKILGLRHRCRDTRRASPGDRAAPGQPWPVASAGCAQPRVLGCLLPGRSQEDPGGLSSGTSALGRSGTVPGTPGTRALGARPPGHWPVIPAAPASARGPGTRTRRGEDFGAQTGRNRARIRERAQTAAAPLAPLGPETPRAREPARAAPSDP